MSKGFQKFIQREETGAQKKERIRQEKKVVRKETQAFFEKKKEEAKAMRAANQVGRAGSAPLRENESPKGRFQSSDNRKGFKGGKREDNRERKPYTASGDSRKGKYSASKGTGGSYGSGSKAGFRKASNEGFKQSEGAGFKKSRPSFDKPERKEDGFKKSSSFKKQPYSGSTSKASSAKYSPATSRQNDRPDKEPVKKTITPKFNKQDSGRDDRAGKVVPKKNAGVGLNKKSPSPATEKSTKTGSEKNYKSDASEVKTPQQSGGLVKTGIMPLNKFIAHAGICSRRDAADVVKSGKVVVNGTVITEPGFKVSDKDEIKVNGKKIAVRRNLVYILLNKPKDFITTTEDPQGRKTVLDIVRNATDERVYPIGRLDRNTTGVLLLTNDGELAQKLSHPSYEVKKIYEVTLDKPLVKKDFDAILAGIQLEDGFIAPDVLAYADSKDKAVIGIEIHSGRNRIVRRIFEAVGYDVRNLDRVMYANLTKKNVDRGKWRFLSEKEVRLLKYLNASYTNKNKPARRG